ncbi:MAG: 1-deoxy-D-xylulose-5-phosphate synthase [Thermaerobacterales bacterium]
MGEILAGINSPEDVKRLSHQEKLALATELRETILATVAQSGGHLGAGLGAVELTLALHATFASPTDKIIWDVGHQAYSHKLMTGRREVFSTIRQTGGISGFPRRTESIHDAFGTAHASTSISAGLGYARARDLRSQDHHVVVVIGDGGMTGGMAFEALNNAGHSDTDLIVILNDNSMSIAPNVGALSSYLTRIRTEPAYTRLRDDIERLVRSIPRFGDQIARTADRVKGGLKQILVPGMFFEELGFTYLGPIDGHDLAAVERVLRDAKRLKGPVLIHAITTKGKGYQPAEGDPMTWHGPGPFKVATGESLKKSGGAPGYSKVFAKTLIRLAEEDPAIVAITAAMPDGTGLDAFQAVFPDRCWDVGIAEQHAVTFSAGLACGGLKPFAAIYSTFLQRAYDQVIHDVAIQKLPVRFCLDRAGLVGADGETHQGAFDIVYLRCIPNMVIMSPKDENELQHMMATALAYEDGPIALRYPRGNGVGVAMDTELSPLAIGKAEQLRQGSDIALIALGPFVQRALAAAEILAQAGVEATVINARFAKPLDEELLTEVLASVPAVVTVEEGVIKGGFGSAVLEICSDEGLTPVIKRLGLPDTFIEHGDPEHFYSELGLTGEGIAAAAHEAMALASERGHDIAPPSRNRRRDAVGD